MHETKELIGPKLTGDNCINHVSLAEIDNSLDVSRAIDDKNCELSSEINQKLYTKKTSKDISDGLSSLMTLNSVTAFPNSAG